MASKGKKETGSVKEKKPSFLSQPHPANNTISRRRSLGPTSIPIPSSPDRIHKQIQHSPKPSKALNVDRTTPKINPAKKLLTPPSTPDRAALQRRRSLDKPPSPSQLPKQLTAQSPREKKLQSLLSSKPKSTTTSSSSSTTTTTLHRPVTKERLSKQISTLPKQGNVERSKTNLTSPKLGLERSSKPPNKDVEKSQALKNVSKNIKKTVPITSPASHVKQKRSVSSYGSIRKPRNNTATITTTNDDESLVGVDDSKIQDSYIVESQKETIDVDELPAEVLILEDNGDSDLVLDDDYLLNQQLDEQINATPMLEMEESQEPTSEDSSSMDSEIMRYQQETIPEDNEDKDEDESGDQTVTNETVKADQTVEEKGNITVVDESKETEEVQPEKENLIVVSSRQGKKDSPAYNDVIEETASRLREQRKNKVRALVGAFETVISLEDPMGEASLPR